MPLVRHSVKVVTLRIDATVHGVSEIFRNRELAATPDEQDVRGGEFSYLLF